MSGYDPNDDWIFQGMYGRMTGQGRGWNGLAGNMEYEAEQRRQAEERRKQRERIARARREKKARQEQERLNRQVERQAKKRAASAGSAAAPQVATDEKPWSTVFAVLGFGLGFFGTVGQSTGEPDLVAAAFVGLIAAWVAGRFYKLILLGLLVWFALSMLGTS